MISITIEPNWTRSGGWKRLGFHLNRDVHSSAAARDMADEFEAAAKFIRKLADENETTGD